MKELTNRIEECLARMKELPALIQAKADLKNEAKETMNGKSVNSKMQDQLKEMMLAFECDAKMEEGSDGKKLWTNENERKYRAIQMAKDDDLYKQITVQISSNQAVQQVASGDYNRFSSEHDNLVREHSALISTVDVLRGMLKIEITQVQMDDDAYVRILDMEVRKLTSQAEIEAVKNIDKFKSNMNKEQEASNEGR